MKGPRAASGGGAFGREIITDERIPGGAGVGEPEPSLRRAWQLFFVAFALLVVVGSVVQFLNLKLGLIVTEVLLLLGPTLWFLRKDGLRPLEFLRIRPVPGRVLVAVFALSFLSFGVAGNLEHLMLTIFPPPEFWTSAMKTVSEELFRMDTWHGAVVSVLGLVLLAGICEEALFRGYLQRVFVRHWGVAAGLLATGALFAAVHLDPWGFVARTFLGVWLGFLVLRTDSIIPSMLAHGTNNLLSLLLTKFAPQVEEGDWSLAATLISIACFAVGALWFHRWIGKREGNEGAPPAPA
jgi:membrane protease YdiL (CAAX protease family)